MYFLLLIETSEDVKDVTFLYENIEKPLKKKLEGDHYNLKEFWFNFRILSKEFQNFYLDECKVRKNKCFIYTYEVDSTFFNQLSEEEILKMLCKEIAICLQRYQEIKPKSYKPDSFVDDVKSIINQWLVDTET